jgi:hypothetical protein
MRDYIDHVFHVDAVMAADGYPLDVNNENQLVVDIDGTVTSGTVEFKYTAANGVVKSLKGIRVSDWTTGTSTTLSGAVSETWRFPVSGLKKVWMDISSLTVGEGQSLTIKGRAGC